MTSLIYEIAYDEKQGRFLRATQDIPEGFLILKEAPLIIGPEEKGVIFCFSCNKILNSTKIRTCKKCKTASVCSEYCEGVWHSSNECDFFSKCSLQCGHFLVSSEIILPLRCLILNKQNFEKWEEVIKLESHLEKRRNSTVWKEISQNIESLFLQLNIISESEIEAELLQRICGILDVNTFEIRSNEVGLNNLKGLYLNASLINHNCMGNIHLAIDDDKNLIIHASTKISKGETIYFNYCNPLKGNHERRITLRQSKHFDCFCVRCKDPSEMKTEISSLKCPRCKIGFVRPINIDPPFKWTCEKCQKNFAHSLMHLTIIEARAQLNALNSSDTLEMENFLRKMSKTFSPNHYLMLEIKQNLIGLYTQSEPKMNILLRKIELCEQLLSVFKIIEPGISRMQGITLYELQRATVLLAEKRLKNKEINQNYFVESLKSVEILLKQSIKHLIYEPKRSPEGRLCSQCFENIKKIRDLMTIVQISSPEKKINSTSNRKLKSKKI